MANSEKKQIPLRLSKDLYDALAKWADDDFRSLNAQIEYLLTDLAKKHKRLGRKSGEASDDETA